MCGKEKQKVAVKRPKTEKKQEKLTKNKQTSKAANPISEPAVAVSRRVKGYLHMYTYMFAYTKTCIHTNSIHAYTGQVLGLKKVNATTKRAKTTQKTQKKTAKKN